MTGYVRQSAADIVPTAVVRAAPINNELNALRDAFNTASGHKHDGTTAEGHPVPVIGDSDLNNKIATDTANNRHGVFVEVGGTAVEQVRIQDGAIVPVTDNDIDLGTSSLEFKDLYIDGTANIDSLIADTADINAGTIDNTVVGATTPAAATVTNLTVNSAAVIASADINAGTIDGAVIGGAAAQAITGTTITATTGFVGGLTGAVTGNTTGTHTGAVVGNVTGDLTGNVTASSGSSSFNDVVINGGLNMNAGTSATITNLTTPTNAGDAATKGYVDTADALKLNLSGGTMSGAIAMGTNKITGLGIPTATADAATKGYVDTSIANLIDTAPGTLDTLNELAAALGDDPNFATTVTNEIATKVAKAGDTMSGNLAMGGNKVTGLGAPTLSGDAATKTYVDTADALKLNLTGGTMSGAIAMGTNKITGVGDPTANQDAATKKYVDDQDALNLLKSGGTMSGAIAMGTNKITGLGTPTADADATTKLYVDGILGSATSAAASAAAAATSASNAATSASNASTSASNASTSASNAASSATAAAASYDSFDDRYLGAKSSIPSLDNDGNTLLEGALYWNSTSKELFVWNGTAWEQSTLTAGDFLSTSAINTTVLGYVAPGTSGNILTSNGTAWTSAAAPVTPDATPTVAGKVFGWTVTGATGNTALGYNSSLSSTTGVENVSVGANALQSNTTGSSNIAIGAYALQSSVSRSALIAIGTYSLNKANTGAAGVLSVGDYAGYNLTSGYWSVFLGSSAGTSVTTGGENTIVGYNAGTNVTTGSANTLIGAGAASSLTTGLNNIVIGLNADVTSATVNHEITIGNLSHTSFRIPGLSLTWTSSGLPITNGGTGSNNRQGAINALVGAVTSGQYLRGNGTNVVLASLSSSDLTGAVSVLNGGTGSSSLAANNVILGNGTSAVQVVAPGTSGNVLTSNGTTWMSTAPAAQVYPSAGIAVSTGTAWGTSKTTPSGDLVGTTDSQTLTNKTMDYNNNTFTNFPTTSLSQLHAVALSF